jgi:hypothetical protein
VFYNFKFTTMKKIILAVTAILLIISCQNDDIESTTPTTNTIALRGCATQEVLAAQLAADPTLAIRMNQIETFTQKAMLTNRLADGKIEIPVVVNVLYRTAAENISLAQIQSQIDVLNEDFNATNADYNSVPALFSGVKANIGITFVLQNVVRKSTKTISWSTNNAMKSSRKGIAPTTPTTVLNIWSCNMGGGILGYAQFPGGADATDGIVIDNNAFGRTGTVSGVYNLGRTATHEVGHWMNLRHIWGDSTCGNDLISDTPTHNTANYGVPAYPHLSTCTGTPVEMTMNYMDYTDDRGMYMFTIDQKSRMNAIFVSGGARSAFGI